MSRLVLGLVLCSGLSNAKAAILTAVGGAGTILRSTDSGETWTPQSSGTGPWQSAPALKSVDFLGVDNGWAIGDCIGLHPTVRRTVDGGQNWGGVTLPPIVSQPGHCATAVQFANADVGWIIGNPGLVFRTTDGGTTWLQQSNGVPASELYDLDFVDFDNGWIVGNEGQSGLILHTADGGANYSQVSTGTSGIFLGVDFVDANTGWIVGTIGRHTTDGGATWDSQAPGGFRDVHFIDAMTGWVVGENGVISHTSDGGLTWAEQYRSANSSHLMAVDFISPDEGWAVGEAGTILHTVDGGASWVPQVSGTVQTLQDIIAFHEPFEDFDYDGDVDGNDFLKWQTGYGKQSGANHREGDADGDRDVDGDDLSLWQSQFAIAEPSSVSVATIPEPTSITMLLLIVTTAALSRCRVKGSQRHEYSTRGTGS